MLSYHVPTFVHSSVQAWADTLEIERDIYHMYWLDFTILGYNTALA